MRLLGDAVLVFGGDDREALEETSAQVHDEIRRAGGSSGRGGSSGF
jgi:hypothetical protein